MANIETKIGNIFDLAEGILVHGCNCQGAMGSGVAGQLRKKWPAVYDAYHERHAKFGLQLGDVVIVGSTKLDPTGPHAGAARHLHAKTTQLPASLIVVNAMTQFNYGRDPNTVYVDYAAVTAAFARLSLLARDTGLTVNFPLIGCGLANGDWGRVAAAIKLVNPYDAKLVLWKQEG